MGEEYSPFIKRPAEPSAPIYEGNIQLRVVSAAETVYAMDDEKSTHERTKSKGMHWTEVATLEGLKESEDIQMKLQRSQITGERLTAKELQDVSYAQKEGKSASTDVYRNIMQSNRQELDFSVVPEAFPVSVAAEAPKTTPTNPTDNTSSASYKPKGYEINEYKSIYDEVGKPSGYLVSDYKSIYD
jgi:hypothetical protein